MKEKRFLIRVDASEVMGAGHLRRCLSLSQALLALGASVVLVVRRLDGLAERILAAHQVSAQLDVVWLPPPNEPMVLEEDGTTYQSWAGVGWQFDVRQTIAALRNRNFTYVIVDHYAFDARWHEAVRARLKCQVAVVDDLADRFLAADVIIDQNYHPNHRSKYSGCLVQEPIWLMGPNFALLGAEYKGAQRYVCNEHVKSLGIFMGATDPGEASSKVVQICRGVGFSGPIEIVSTDGAPHIRKLKRLVASSPFVQLSLNLPSLAEFFSRHDIQIGAGGGATWERCCIGVPSIAVVLAANQKAVVPELDRVGALRAAMLDESALSSALPSLSAVLQELLYAKEARLSLAQTAAGLVDGRGADRVALVLMRDFFSLRKVNWNDGCILYQWRNHPSVRNASINSNFINFCDHLKWLKNVIVARDRMLLIGEIGGRVVGTIRFDKICRDRYEVSLYTDPDLKGLGFGRLLLNAGEDFLQHVCSSDFSIYARVLIENKASQRLFEHCGYRKLNDFFYKRVSGIHPTHEGFDENT